MSVTVTAPSPLHRFDAETYERIAASGALEDVRVELIDGFIVDMSPIGTDHDELVSRLTRHLISGDGVLRVQSSLRAAADSTLQPDLALVEHGSYMDHHPRTALLVVEVAASSLRLDGGSKAKLYARAGVPLYWVVKVEARAVEVMSEPEEGAYRERATYHADRPPTQVPAPLPGVEPLDVPSLFAP